MSYRLVDLVIKHSRARNPDKTVLMMLAWHCNDKTGVCFPGIDTLATECGLVRNSVLRAIDELERSGELKVNRRRGQANGYELALGGADTSAPQALVTSAPQALVTSAPKALVTSAPKGLDQCTTGTGPVHHVHPNKELNRELNKEERALRAASRARAREAQPQPARAEAEPQPQPETRTGVFGPDPPPFPEDLADDPRVVAWRLRWDGTNGPPLPPLAALVAEFRAWAQANGKRYVDWPRQFGIWVRRMFSPVTDRERAIADAQRAVREPDSREGKALAALVEFVGAATVDRDDVLRHAQRCRIDYRLAVELIELHFDYARGHREVMNRAHVIEQASAQEAAAALERQRLH